MSQFDFPRINFHGTAILDTPTANNGNYEPGLTMFDQDESEPFIPPRCYIGNLENYVSTVGITVLSDKIGKQYVPIIPVNEDNYQQWATSPLGTCDLDKDYWTLYGLLGLTGSNPGYWNYYGDVSCSLVNTMVTGITAIDNQGQAKTYSQENMDNCPSYLSNLFGSELSFNNQFFSLGSRTTAYLCDVDSIGQMCTQIFCSTAGLYKTDSSGQNTTFFIGTPVKTTARWMNLNKVLNYSDGMLTPMGGSACFYAKINLSKTCELSNIIKQATGRDVNAVFLKLLIHQVHEIREPDYAKMPTKSIYDMFGNQSNVPKNPAIVAVSGSITPWFEGDMNTVTPSRILKNYTPLTLNVDGIPAPVTQSGKKLKVENKINFAPIQFKQNTNFNLISLDIINAINEYGTNPGTLPDYAGKDDIPAFQNFETFDFGEFAFMYQPVNGNAQLIGTFNHNDYNMAQLIANGGMIDFNVPAGMDYSDGAFFLRNNTNLIAGECDYFITSDQMGNYAQQNQKDNNYMSDGLPRIPCTVNVFYKGAPLKEGSTVNVTMQIINMRTGVISNMTDVPMENGQTMDFSVIRDGCLTYAFIDPQSQILLPKFANLYSFALNNSLFVVRTLADDVHLDPYLTGAQPLTWDVVYNNVFRLFKVLYPVMNAIIPFTEANWSNPTIMSRMSQLIKESNWNQPMYMPVTRDLTAKQIQLLQMWANKF